MQQGGPRPKKQKDKPNPFMFPVQLYTAIRATCIYLCLDGNPANMLNRSSDPMVRQFQVDGSDVHVMYYSPDLLKMWLRFLVAYPLWSREVTALKQTSNKSGYTTYSSNVTTSVRCFHLPHPDEIDRLAPSMNVTAAELRNCAYWIQRLLIEPGPPHTKLLLPGGVIPGTVPRFEEVTSPNNMVKKDRLSDMGYMRAALSADELLEWNEFYNMETSRYKYIMDSVGHTRITDAAIRSLGDNERNMYNQYAVSAYLNNVKELPNLDKTLMTKVCNGNAVNPAMIAFQRLAAASRANKSDSEDSIGKKYSRMMEEYFSLTRHRLNSKEERRLRTLTFRLSDIADMNKIKAANPYVSFMHNPVTNRYEIISMVSTVLPQAQHVQQPPVHNQQLPKVTRVPMPHFQQQVPVQPPVQHKVPAFPMPIGNAPAYAPSVPVPQQTFNIPVHVPSQESKAADVAVEYDINPDELVD
jgi:hypothetical protein